MDWQIKKLVTSDDGSVDDEGLFYPFSDISINETVGDELYIESGDLVLKRAGAITPSLGDHEWISVYIDSVMVGVYRYDEDAYEKDEKRGLYIYRFKSIQKHFLEKMHDIAMTYSAVSNEINYALNGTLIDIFVINVLDGDGVAHNFVGRFGFSIGDILDNLSGLDNSLGFVIDDVTHPLEVAGSPYVIPVLWRGRGHHDTQTESIVIRSTFDFETFWEFTVKHFEFTVSGITVDPSVGDVYSNNSSNFELIEVNISSGSGTLMGVRTSGTNNPSASGTLTRVSGSGDASITFSAYSVVTDLPTNPIAYSSIYSNNYSNYEVIEIGSGTIRCRRISGTNSPNTSGYLTNVSGAGDAKIGYSSWDSESSDIDMRWDEFFEIVSVGWNAYIAIIPKIESSTLKIDIKIIPRIELTASGQISVVSWSERKLIKEKYKIDGVAIAATNYTFIDGDDKGHLMSKSVNLGERGQPNSNNETDLHIGITQYYGSGGYDYTNPDDFFYKSGGTAFIEPWYEDMIGAGDGYEGTALILYNDGSDKILKTLDQLTFSSIDVQITSLRIMKNFMAKISAIEI